MIKMITMAHRLFALLLLFTIILPFSCKQEVIEENDEIHIRLKKDPERLHPLIFPNPLAREVYQYIHLPLADFHPEDLSFSPVLIKAIPVKTPVTEGKWKGGVRFDIEILEDAVWENNSPVTGNDVLFTVKSVMLPMTNAARYRESMQYIADVEIDPENQKKCSIILSEDHMSALEISLNFEIYPAYFYDKTQRLSTLDLTRLKEDTSYVSEVMQDTSYIQFSEAFNGQNYSSSLISGAGPYSFVSWESDQYIILEKKQDYWGNKHPFPSLKQNPDKIVFSIIPDELSAILQLKEGKIDVMNEVSSDAFEELKNDTQYASRFHFFTPQLNKYYCILMNNSDPKLQDPKIRKALNHLLDVDKIVQSLESGHGKRLFSPVHPNKPYYLQSLTPVSFDISMAGKLIKEAGWSDSNQNGVADKLIDNTLQELKLDIYITGQELGKRVALLLQENAAKAGIEINIVEKDMKLIRAENIKTRSYHLIPTVISYDHNLWDDLKPRWHSTSDSPTGANDISYHNDEADRLLDEILQEENPSKRTLLYHKLQKIIYDDYPVIFMYVPMERIIVGKNWNAKASMKRPGYAVNAFELVAAK